MTTIPETTHITFEEFVEQYQPMKNHLHPDAPYGGFMYETYGPEMEHVKQHKGTHLWTLLIGDNNELVLCSGVWFVNRMGYIITHVPHCGWVEVLDM